MVRIILQTVQNQDKVLKDLYNHLRYVHSVINLCTQKVYPCGVPDFFSYRAVNTFCFLLCFYSTILACKRRIVDLIPKLEAVVETIKSTESAVMQMQMERQKEFWNLLKIVCVSVRQI